MQLLYNIAGIIIVILIIPMFMVRSVREKGFVGLQLSLPDSA